jgi:type II secretory pathway pseudopilin PulG
MRHIRSTQGITLIEMVVVITVLGLSIPVLLNVFADVAWRSAYSEAISDAAIYAGDLMERIKSSNFDDIIATFNGIPDYPGPGYTRTASAGYVKLTGTTWGASVSPTDYIQVTVTVSHNRLISSVSLTTIIIPPYGS